jgi:HEAT repeat protein
VNERFSRGQRAALTALLITTSVRTAAQTAGIGVSTLRRWLSQPDFQEEYRRLSRETHQQAVSAVLSAQREAVAVLVRLLGSTSADVRLRAASKLLDVGHRIAEDDLDQRLARLEEIAEQHETGAGTWAEARG